MFRRNRTQTVHVHCTHELSLKTHQHNVLLRHAVLLSPNFHPLCGDHVRLLRGTID